MSLEEVLLGEIVSKFGPGNNADAAVPGGTRLVRSQAGNNYQ
jgi:hypothetical protein